MELKYKLGKENIKKIRIIQVSSTQDTWIIYKTFLFIHYKFINKQLKIRVI